ncbi:MAG TPA: hypothetical protein VHU80_14325 [Polyangiaceae bacterium]|nr:hypothetical protein [Polyangiaceae bacterium]
MKARSTLLTSPLSAADFALRLAFFALAPMGIVFAAELFPVRGALIDVALALGVFAFGETARRAASNNRAVRLVISEALAFETYYRERPPRPFAYYLFYPLLFPYWLSNASARREFLMFRGYTAGSFLVLIASLTLQYFEYWRPELRFAAFLSSVLHTLIAETILVLSLLMPIATTVVWYHTSHRRRRLSILLLTGLVSASIAFALVVRRRDPIVSMATRDRVRLRTKTVPLAAHETLVTAARAASKAAARGGLDGDGKIEGEPLELCRAELEKFYKHDEAFAFDLWGTPRRKPKLVVLYFESRQGKPPIWVAVRNDGSEIDKRGDLPTGAMHAMSKAADGTDPLLPVWPSEVPRAKKLSETPPRQSAPDPANR